MWAPAKKVSNFQCLLFFSAPICMGVRQNWMWLHFFLPTFAGHFLNSYTSTTSTTSTTTKPLRFGVFRYESPRNSPCYCSSCASMHYITPWWRRMWEPYAFIWFYWRGGGMGGFAVWVTGSSSMFVSLSVQDCFSWFQFPFSAVSCDVDYDDVISYDLRKELGTSIISRHPKDLGPSNGRVWTSIAGVGSSK